MSDAKNGDLPTGPKPGNRETVFLDDPTVDHLLRAVVTLTMELSVTRERLATVETLLAEGGALDRDRADAFVPPSDDAREREVKRAKLIDDTLGPLVKRLASEG